ncbi:hypothetical protein C8C83_2913 [Flavobacterium sp. 90]|uniref:hypothetical protein n=1 Tax=unclassified Flavobacterium TaxID=196869 RepID=UPI000EAB80E6|nr:MULTISPECIES: hypothetical protein [unclassified Flavobacterium]RKR11213.1 hypothetical protein C8C82_3223 [Flavobacterium sp. 81]TCK54994.1 hypothetical protein C8C83_2913 [Flavobacterium sp. 90]
MKKQNIEDIFSSMEDFSSVPPPELWGQIEEKLDKPKKKKSAILWWSAAACLLLGLLLPSVLHFTSDSGIKNLNTDSSETNKVVIEEKNEEHRNNLNNTAIPTEENKALKDGVEKESNTNEGVSPSSKKVNNQPTTIYPKSETAVAQADSENKIINNSTSSKLDIEKSVTEKNSKSNIEKKNTRQAVAEQTFATGKGDSFNSVSIPRLRDQLPNHKKTATDKILAEKTFNSGKTNGFNSNTKSQLSNSIFEDKTSSKNSSNVAFTSSNPTLKSNNNVTNTSKVQNGTTTIDYSKRDVLASAELSNSKVNNSKANNSESKIDSVQLLQLQNLEKGIAIAEPETKKDKKNKSLSNAEKWAVEVFAGIANSENTKNDKTLGYANDSKQGSTYGVKTKYKINNKWAVGSGLKINELGQSVANVSYIDTKTVASLSPANYYVASESIAPARITNNSSYIFVSNSTTDALKMNDIQSENLKSGNIDQSLRYLEMPLEVSYAVFTKNKASISLNTGGFVGKLISNDVALNGKSIGDNVNANDFVYGSTLSTTLQYRIYKKTNVFAEPAVNYYLNPLNNQSFNQFQWGLNFGLNVSF